MKIKIIRMYAFIFIVAAFVFYMSFWQEREIQKLPDKTLTYKMYYTNDYHKEKSVIAKAYNLTSFRGTNRVIIFVESNNMIDKLVGAASELIIDESIAPIEIISFE